MMTNEELEKARDEVRAEIAARVEAGECECCVAEEYYNVLYKLGIVDEYL